MTTEEMKCLNKTLNRNFNGAMSIKRPLDSCIRLAVLATQIDYMNKIVKNIGRRIDEIEDKQKRTLALLGAIKSGSETVIRSQRK